MAAETPASKQSKAFVSLQKSIERQKQKITDVELKHNYKAASLSKLKEFSDMLIKITNKESSLHEDCQKELQQMKILNSSMSNDVECIKKEVEQMTKELEESKIIKEKLEQITKELQDSKSLNDLQQKNFTEEIRKNLMQISSLQLAAMKQQNEHKNDLKLVEDLKDKNEILNAKIVELENQTNFLWMLTKNKRLKKKLDALKDMEDEFLKTVGTLHVNIMEKEQLLQDSEDFNQSLIIKERESNDELQKARKRMIEGIVERSTRNGNIGVKRMGELDTKPFLKAFRAKMKYNKEEAEQRALEVCSIWEKYLNDPQWHPFEIITVDGEPQEKIVWNDEKLKQLRKEVSLEAQLAVIRALSEMNEHNPSGRFVVSELWNHEMKRKATLEGVEFLLGQWKTKKRKIHQTGTDYGENTDNGNAASLYVGKGK